MDLCNEEEHALQELIDARNRGQRANEFINKRLYAELSEDKIDDNGVNHCEPKEGFIEQEQAYKSLADKGYIEAEKPRPDIYWFGDLTLEGRNYFENKKRRLKQAREEKWSNRRFTIIWGIITMIVSVTLSFISSHIELPQQSEADSMQNIASQESASS